MRLYYFTSQKYGMAAIRKRRLKIARINDLNDPFELLAWNLQYAEFRRDLLKWKNETNELLGIVCFSRSWAEPLLWGHYADKHKGIALGFDVPDGDKYHELRYRKARLPRPTGRILDTDDVDDLLLTKFRAWRYEKEHRCICLLRNSVHEKGLYFEPFSDELKLAEVIVGHRSTVTRAQLKRALGKTYRHVTAFKARPAFGSFRVVRNRDERLWS
jgi:hypothetical protein